MTRQKLPDNCDFCGKEISSAMQYTSEWFQGRGTFSDPRTRLKEKLDCCHSCFLEVCKNGLKPTWIKEHKNPNHIAGAKKGSGHEYFIAVIEPDLQQKISSEVPV